MASITNNIPSDIWGEILVRLPAECLLRSRAVSKGWRAVIEDPCFVRAHTNKHQQQPNFSSSKIIIQEKAKYSYEPLSCCLVELEALTSFQRIPTTRRPLDLPGALLLPMAACNGLLLTQKPFTIWNPLTHERLWLPRVYKKYVWAFGLGYDATTDDYKAVAILRNRETHVYSLKSDSWRRIMMNCPCEGRDWRGPLGAGVFVCGALNWLSIGEGCAYEDKIVALDLGTEKYSRLQMPHLQPRGWDNKKPKSQPGLLLSVLGGRLALCDSVKCSGSLVVWVMKDEYDDDDSSWVKVCSIERAGWGCLLRHASFFMEEEKLFVFLQDVWFRFYLFDVESNCFERLSVDGIGKHREHLHAKQMFVGTMFRLRANCAGGGVRNKSICTKKKKAAKKKKKNADQ